MREYKQLIVYYFSGTGNAKNVVNWIAEVATEKNILTELIDISKIDRKQIPQPPANALVGFCSPTHGFNFPPVMMNFIFRFPKANKNNKVFIINTRAGVRISKFYIPGFSGYALLLAAICLIFKRYRITGMRPVDMPSNWISLHPGVRPKGIELIFSRCKKIVVQFANRVLTGKNNYRGLYSLPVDATLGLACVFYYLFGRFLFAKSFYASRDCNNCEICIKQCPVKAISLVDNRPFWSYQCESCMHCMNVCPKSAVETAHGYIIGLLILMNFIMQSFVYIWLLKHNINWFSESTKYGSLLRFIFSTLVAFFALVLSYRLVHYLRKIKVIDFLVQRTSLTSYKFWGRYKPLKNIKI